MDILTARTIADELYTAPTERLREFAETPGVFLSLSALIGIQRSGNKIGAEELLLLNGIVSAFESSPKRYAAGSITTTEKHVADSLADMMAKYAFLYPDYTSPCNVEQAFNLGGDAIAYGKARSFSMGELSLFSACSDEVSILNASLCGFNAKKVQDGFCIASGQYCQKPKNIKSKKRYLVSFAYLSENASFDNMLDFAKQVSELKDLISAFAAKGNELLLKLCELSPRLSIFSERIPTFQASDDLTKKEKIYCSLSDFFFKKDSDKCAIAIVSKLNALSKASLNNIAKKHGIEIYHPIEINNIPRITVSSMGNTLTSLPSSILRTVIRTEALDIEIPAQKAVLSEFPVISKFESPETGESVYTASITPAEPSLAFSAAVTAVISPFIAAVYDGINVKNSDFSISVNAELSMPRDYAALLGLYRAITEMGVMTEGSSLTITDSDPSFSVALKATSFKERSDITVSLSQEELLKSLIGNGEMPDFSALRSLINGQNI